MRLPRAERARAYRCEQLWILYVDPYLPHWLPDIKLDRLEIGNDRIELRFWREGECTCWDATVPSGRINVQQKPWQPWNVEDYRLPMALS